MDEILELKFSGNDIDPSKVKPHEIAELIFNFEKTLLNTIKEEHPEIDINQLLFSFESIEHYSIDLKFKPVRVPELVVESYTLVSSSIAEGDFSRLNKEAVEGLKKITAFSRRHNCNGYLNYNNKTLSSFTPSTEITLDKSHLIKGEVTVYGKLLDAGGEKPNVHLKLDDGSTLIFPTTEANAKRLANKLYEQVALTGIGKWSSTTLKVEEFRLGDILDYKPGKALDAINKLKNITSGFWDQFNNNNEINNQLLRD